MALPGSLCGLRRAQEHLLRQRFRQQDRHQELRWSARSDPAAQEDSRPRPHGHYHRLEAHWGPLVVRGKTSWSVLTLFHVPPQVRCGTCPLTTPLKWRSWTTRCTPSPTRWWCRTRAGRKGATGPEPGRRTASPGIWSGRRPSPTQQAAWGTQGRWAGDGRTVAACRYRREMGTSQGNRLTERWDVCGSKRALGSGNRRPDHQGVDRLQQGDYRTRPHLKSRGLMISTLRRRCLALTVLIQTRWLSLTLCGWGIIEPTVRGWEQYTGAMTRIV